MEIQEKLRGTGVALVTPFTSSGEVDKVGISCLVQHLTRHGVGYMVVMGTTGESATISHAEKQQVLQQVLEQNAGKLPVVYGIGGNHTAQVLEALRETSWDGISALLSVSPYYNKPSQQGIIRHYQAIADASPVPVILYNVPGRTASNLSVATTLELAQHPNIIGTKEASGDLLQCMEIARSKPADFMLISGDDLLAVPMISIGACGVISVLANAFPSTIAQMVNQALVGNFDVASRSLYKLLHINSLMYEEGNPVGVKQTLKLLGICDSFVRLPLVEASPSLVSRIRQTMEQEGLLP
jgi:4-hydroxy-tetrahydrodipicolinate synthase